MEVVHAVHSMTIGFSRLVGNGQMWALNLTLAVKRKFGGRLGQGQT